MSDAQSVGLTEGQSEDDSSGDIDLGDYTPCGVCPICGEKLESGYGLAYGGEVGPYEFCTGEDCGFYHKWSDPT